MNTFPLHKILLGSMLTLLPQAGALLLDAYKDPVTSPTAGDITAADWFANESSKEAGWLQRTCSTEEVRAQEQLEHLLQHPDDEDAYCALAQDCDGVNAVIKSPGFTYTGKQYVTISPLLRYRNLLSGVKGAPGRAFILRMRDFLRGNPRGQELALGIYRWLEEEENLTEPEIQVLSNALSKWLNVHNSSKIQAAYARLFMKEFRGLKEIQLTPKQEERIFSRHPSLRPFVLAAGALNGMPVARKERENGIANCLLHELTWQNAPEVLPLARHLRLFGFELLRRTPDSLPAYLNGRGIAQNGGYLAEVPTCCYSALAGEESTTREQVAKLPPELGALGTRCLLAAGAQNNIWQPVSKETNPARWPDASAVTLPQWKPELLGLADEKPETLQAAFATDLKELGTHLNTLEVHGMRGALLCNLLSKCDSVRPVVRDLTLPVYQRIALALDEDGINISFDEESENFRIERGQDELTAPVELLLHRLTLLLALQEKSDSHTAMQASCAQLARLLNRHRLWPLVICQRELRDFSPRTLLTLFTHYEGEAEPLEHYGEAMGLAAEMNLARLALEDELGDTLLLAATISGAIPATDEARQNAVANLLEQAKAAPDSELAAETVSHLLRNGQHRAVADWKECPSRCFCGRYAANGLRLIRALLQDGQQEAAGQLLATMADDKDTDTTPAYRLACALLSRDEQEKARLHKDALLLALVHRSFDYAAYRDSMEELALAEGSADSVMKAELLLSGGKSAGITPRMVQHYTHSGLWEEAAFASRCLVAEGISTATPYGTTPSQADIVRYGQCAGLPAQKTEQQPAETPVHQPQPLKTGPQLSCGTLLSADVDLSAPAQYVLYLKQGNNIKTLHSASPELNKQDKEIVRQFCAEPTNLRHLAPHIAATPQEALRLAEEHQLPILVLTRCMPQNCRAPFDLNLYRDLYPETGEWLRRHYILMPLKADLLSNEDRAALLQLEQTMAPGLAPENTPMAQAIDSDNSNAAMSLLPACILRKGSSECGSLQLSASLPPEKVLQSLVPFTKPDKN